MRSMFLLKVSLSPENLSICTVKPMVVLKIEENINRAVIYPTLNCK